MDFIFGNSTRFCFCMVIINFLTLGSLLLTYQEMAEVNDITTKCTLVQNADGFYLMKVEGLKNE